jgi:hypothetical protein
MAEEVSNSNENQIEQSNNDQPSNLHEFRVKKTTTIKINFY